MKKVLEAIEKVREMEKVERKEKMKKQARLSKLFLHKLAQFMKECAAKQLSHSKWIESRKLKVYLRKSARIFNTIDGRLMPPNQNGNRFWLDISNIDVSPSLRDTGIFTSFLNLLEENLPNTFIGIFVENVLCENKENADKLIKFLVRNGYQLVDHPYNTTLPCYFKLRSEMPVNDKVNAVRKASN